MEFDGDDTCGAAPTSGTHNWYSDGTGLSWFTLSQTFDIPITGATLSFWNYFSIEADYDYGFVEARIVGTEDWYTLPGLGTTDYYANYYDNINCPDEREPFAYNASGRWNAFTGESYGLYHESMDLSMFAGETIELVFTYWTDPYSLGSGWYIDDIEIPEIGFSDDCETQGDWLVSNIPEGFGWYLNDDIIYNNFEVAFIKSTTLTKKNGEVFKTWHHIDRMGTNDDTEEGKEFLTMINWKRISSKAVMVVSNQPGYEHTFGTGYTFTAKKWTPRGRWWC